MKRIFARVRTSFSRVSAIVVAAAVATSCATSPTGRKQLIMVPEGQLNVMGAQAFDQMKAQQPRVEDPAWNNYVKCIAMPLLKIAAPELGIDKWEIVVFKDETANAFALPGGKVGVHTGLFKVAKTDSQLAAVIGHEIGHVIARHGNERMSEGLVAQVGLAGLGMVTKDNPNSGLILAALGLGTQVGILMPHGRTQESEADVIGLDLMSRAGFDPRQSVELWKNMSASGGAKPPEFLSTHPSDQTRINNLQSRMDESLGKYQKAVSGGQKPSCNRPSGSA